MGKTSTKSQKLPTKKNSQPRSSDTRDSSPPLEIVQADPSLIPRLSPEPDAKKRKRRVSTDKIVLPPSKSHLGGHLKFATDQVGLMDWLACHAYHARFPVMRKGTAASFLNRTRLISSIHPERMKMGCTFRCDEDLVKSFFGSSRSMGSDGTCGRHRVRCQRSSSPYSNTDYGFGEVQLNYNKSTACITFTYTEILFWQADSSLWAKCFWKGKA